LLPSISSLIAFEAVARHLSFSKAAEEISLTQSAVSRQVIALEQMIGLQLFERRSSGLILSESGASYLVDVVYAIERLSTATARVMSSRKNPGIVHVASADAFALLWLLPRLPRFYARYPDIQIMLHTLSMPFNFEEMGIEIGISMSLLKWPGTIVDPLLTTPAIAVCSPSFKEKHRLSVPDDLVRVPLIQHVKLPNFWREWLVDMGVSHPDPFAGQQYDQFLLATQAAASGLGVVVVPHFVVEAELRAGTLIEPFAERPKRNYTYSLFRSKQSSRPVVQLLRDWLVEEASLTGR
jgi:LysR family glycine cleavage system transcriptional activator